MIITAFDNVIYIIIILGKTNKRNLEKGNVGSVNKVSRLDDDSENSGKNV